MSGEALKTKLRAMRGGLLKRNDYISLSRLGSVEEVGASLKNFPGYDRALGPLSSERLRRAPLERRLVFSLTDDYADIRRFVTGYRVRGLMENFFLKYEIRIIQTLITNISDERPGGFDPEELNRETRSVFNIKLAGLLSAKTVPELIAGLKGTAYYPVLSRVYRGDISPFTLVNQLDLFYYLNLWDKVNGYGDKKEIEPLRRVVGTEIDLKNIIWVYRFKRYRTEASTIFAHLIPAGYAMSMPELKRIAEAGGESAAKKYKRVFVKDASLEACYHSKMIETMERVFKKEPDSAALIFAYLFFKELEIYNVTSLIEGVRYGLPPSDILSYLSLPGTGVN